MLIENNETFLSELTKFFQKNQNKAIYLTMKRYDGRVKPKTCKEVIQQAPPQEYKCLIKVKTGKKKISTIVNAKDVNKFQLAYTNLLKGNLYGLKKKDKKKGSGKSKATQ